MLDNATGEMKTAIALAALAGLRRSEILALTWDKIDFNKKYILVNAAIVRDQDNIRQEKLPKSVAGYRKVPISSRLMIILQEAPKTFPHVYNSNETTIFRKFNRLLKKLGIPHYRFHDLRRYYASTLLAINMPDKYAMKLMGHSSNNTLKQVYQHVMADKEAQFEKNLLTYQDNIFNE